MRGTTVSPNQYLEFTVNGMSNITAISNDEGIFEITYGDKKLANCYMLASSQRYLKSIEIFNYDISNVTDIQMMFANCSNLATIPKLDTSKVTNMGSMFKGCSNLATIPKLDTSKVTNMSGMFSGCTSLTTIPQLDISNVKWMNVMFCGCSSLTSFPLLDAYSVTDMDRMFYSCRNLTTLGGFKGLKVNLDLSSSTKITHESLMNVINYAADVTSSPKTLTLGEENLVKLTNEEKAIATNKGWILK